MDNHEYLTACEQTFTVSSNRIYLDELPAGQPVLSVINTMDRYNHMKEWLYNRVYDNQFLGIPFQAENTTRLLKQEYFRLYHEKLSDYYCTSLQSCVSGMISSQKELLKLYEEQNQLMIVACESKIESVRESLIIHQEIKQYLIDLSRSKTKGTAAPDNTIPERYDFAVAGDTICFHHKKYIKLYSYECRLDRKIRAEKNRITFIQEKIKRLSTKRFDVPQRITFGSRADYRKKDTMKLSGSKLDLWHEKRDASRMKRVNFSGRHTSRYGNYQCRYDTATKTIQITLLDQKVLTLNPVKFPYRGDELVSYLENRRGSVGYAMELRTDAHNRDYLIVKATITDEKEDFNYDTSTGCIAFDTNEDNFAWCDLDGHGQKLDYGTIRFSLDGKSSDERKAELAMAINQLVGIADRAKKPMAMENLDFFRKKASMKYQDASYNRMLSAFAYRQIMQLTASACYRNGIGLFVVPPAYTSLIGKLKYMRTFGCAIHTAAAYVIGRRALGFQERIPGYLRRVVKYNPNKNFFSLWKPVQAHTPKLPWFMFYRKIPKLKKWNQFEPALKNVAAVCL